MMADQLFKSIQINMVDVSQDSAINLANVRAARREAILYHLPPTFKIASKVNLQQPSIHSNFLLCSKHLDFLGMYPPGSEKNKALEWEIQLLPNKGAIETVPPTPGFYSHLFVVTRSSGGYWPILDLSLSSTDVSKQPSSGWKSQGQSCQQFGKATE